MKPVHLPITGHDLLAVERYHDDTRHMIEFLVFTDCPMGARASTSGAFSRKPGMPPPWRPSGRAISKSADTAISLRDTSCPTGRKNAGANNF